MFSQQKKFYQKKIFYAVLAVSVFSFGLWMNHSMNEDNSKLAMKSQAAEQPKVESVAEHDKPSRIQVDEPLIPESREDVYDPDHAIPDMTAEPPYYFIQAQDGIVKIFHYDENGNGELLRTTSISFSLLSDVDQDLLKDGIIRHTEEEMMEFLQDFES